MNLEYINCVYSMERNRLQGKVSLLAAEVAQKGEELEYLKQLLKDAESDLSNVNDLLRFNRQLESGA